MPAKAVLYLLIDKGDRVITSAEEESNGVAQVYPNPASDRITIGFLPGFESISIIDMRGGRR